MLVAHTGTRDGFYHCNSCGCCFDKSKQPRAGHPVCTLGLAGETVKQAGKDALKDAEPEPAEPSPDDANDGASAEAGETGDAGDGSDGVTEATTDTSAPA